MSKKALFAFLSALVICACTESTDEANTQCKDSEHLFADRCEFDDVTHCGTHTNDCTKLSGWKSGSCIGKTCFAEECHVGYHLASHFDNENKESTICEEDTHDACGSSNTKCGTTEICHNGKCRESCKPGEVICNEACVNPMTNPNYCGADASCNSYIACTEAEDCVEGKCVDKCMCPTSCANGCDDHCNCVCKVECVTSCGSNGKCMCRENCKNGCDQTGECACPEDCTTECNADGECLCPESCKTTCNAKGECACPEDCTTECNADGECLCPESCKTACNAKGECVEFLVGPEKMQLEKGDDGEIIVSYLENTEIDISTDSKDCVSVAADSVNTDASGKATIKITAVGAGCDANITVSSGDQKKVVAVNVIDNSGLKLSTATVTLDQGSQETILAQYISSSDVSLVANKVLTLTSSNKSCVKVEDSVTTDSDGLADIVLTAADDAEAGCTSFITVKPPKGASANITTTVVGNTDPQIVGTPSLSFSPESITTPYVEKDKKDFTVTFKDGNNKGIQGQKITFTVDNSACVKLSNASKRTVEDGTAENAILILKDNCNAQVTAKAIKSGKTYEAKLPVTIDSITSYDMKLALKYENTRYFNSIHYTAYKITQESCASIQSTYKGYDNYLLNYNYNNDDSNDNVSGNLMNNILNTFDLEDIDVDNDKAIVAWGAVDGFGDATAVGCIDISSANANQTVIVELDALPLDIRGKYDIIANFDLTSAFPKTQNSLPPVEDMKAGDWVGFVVDLFKNPVELIFEFTWANVVSRLKAISSDNNIVKGIINFITSDSTKQLAVKSLTPLIEKYLNGEKEGQQTWYQILKTISGDVEELVRNMQFNGYFNIAEVDANDKSLITSASETFKSLEYQWNFVPQGGAKTCLSNAYAKPGACLTQMVLNGKLEPVNGNWTGSVTNSNESDGLLKINSHPVTFKWATILYSVVFGEMLPRAIGYSDSKYVSKQGADGYRYMTAFMNTLVYRPIAKYYGQEKAGKPKDNGDGTYPSLSIEGADKDCQRFIEALVYLIYSDASSAAGVISVIADLACGNQALGQLDALVSTSLSKSESSPKNVLTLSASNCALYSEGQLRYQKMGKPDAEVHSAYEVIQGGKQSIRCNWQIVFPNSISNNPLKGLFHGVRTDL